MVEKEMNKTLNVGRCIVPQVLHLSGKSGLRRTSLEVLRVLVLQVLHLILKSSRRPWY